MSSSLEAKICVLGAQGSLPTPQDDILYSIADHLGVGKTSLLNRYIKGSFSPPSVTSTIGASFLTKRVADVDTGTTVRLQLWDTVRDFYWDFPDRDLIWSLGTPHESFCSSELSRIPLVFLNRIILTLKSSRQAKRDSDPSQNCTTEGQVP